MRSSPGPVRFRDSAPRAISATLQTMSGRFLIVVAMLGLLASACAEDEPTDFTVDNETGFLAACSEPVEDAELVGDVCQCVFERTQAEFPFEDFSAMDDALKADPEQELQAEINSIIADCVISAADL